MLLLFYRRPDGTFVGVVNALPYHIIQSDPLWPEAVAMAAAMGDGLPFEPELPPAPPAPIVLTNRQPTRIELMSRLEELKAQIEALPQEKINHGPD
jgi:hypothetical protein